MSLDQILGKKLRMPDESEALPGRSEEMAVPPAHFVNGNPLQGPFPEGTKTAVFALGCFWGAERKFWETAGVFSTAVGYAGGFTANPSYEEVCSGRTGHTEVVLVVYDPSLIDYAKPAEGLLGVPRPDSGHAPGQRHRHSVPVGRLHHG